LSMNVISDMAGSYYQIGAGLAILRPRHLLISVDRLANKDGKILIRCVFQWLVWRTITISIPVNFPAAERAS
jgi:hypothetical protein